MANSRIEITFNQMPEVAELFWVKETTLDFDLKETFKNQRLSSFQTKIPQTVSIGTPEDPEIAYLGFVTDFFAQAFNLDYNASSLYTILVENGIGGSGIGKVTITANFINAIFEVYDSPMNTSIEIFNEAYIEPYDISNIAFSQGTNPCQTVTATVTTTKLTKKYLEVDNNTNNPFSFEAFRGLNGLHTFEDYDGNIIKRKLGIPPSLDINVFSVNISNSPFGATVTIDGLIQGLNLSYSLSETEPFTVNNFFTGLAEGDYTAFIKDQFGCIKSIVFTVIESGIYNPFFKLSKSLPIRMAKRVNFETTYKTDENTLSCEVDVLQPEKEILLFETADLIQMQLKSNYKSNFAEIINGSEITPIALEKKSNNIGITDKRDAFIYSIPEGKTGVYFIAGNNYDYATNQVISQYTLNGNLPEWATIGNYIQIESANFEIENILYDEDKSADVLILSRNHIGLETSAIVSTVYNRFNYEVYEFLVDMSAFTAKYIRLSIYGRDPNFADVDYLSELINVKVKQEALEIKYFNPENTDVDFSTGIVFLMRVKILGMGGKSPQQEETHRTDSNVYLLSSNLYEADQIKFIPLTKERWRNVMIALSHKNVYLNGVEYVKDGEFTTEGPLGNTNLYYLIAEMIKSENVYSSSIGDGLEFSGEEVEIPGLIKTDIGFLEY